MKSICFVATTPFAVNPFLLGHMAALAEKYRVFLCVNLEVYPLSDRIDKRVVILHVPLERKISLARDLRALFALIGIFRRMRFDAVHSITPKGGLLAMLASFLCCIPLRHHTFTGQIWATRVGASRAFFKLLDRAIVALASRTFADSESQCRFLEREGVARPGFVTVLGKGSIAGVDAQRFHPSAARRLALRAELAATEASCVFLFVGRLVRDKGVFDLVQAFCDLVGKGISAELWMVGPDEDGLLPDLQVSAAVVGERIRWLGRTFSPEHYMMAADVLVLPSYREGFGLVIAEAACCGIPALAYRIDGVIDAVMDGRTGVLIEPGDVNQLRAEMESLAVSPATRQAMGECARAHATANFTAPQVISAWADFYDRALEA